MDWIQIYLIVILSVGALISAAEHGKPRDDHSFWNYIVGLIFAMPYIGRVLGWW